MLNDCRLKISTLEDIWDILLVGCVSLSANGGEWTKSNELTSEFLGYADQELAGKPLSHVTAPADWALEKVLMQRVLAGYDDGYTLAKQFITRDGRSRWARVQANKVVPDDGKPFLVYQIVPGEMEVRTPVEAAAAVQEPTKKPNEVLTFLKTNWKALSFILVSSVMGIAKTYHSFETWRATQERKVENLSRDVQTINSNIEILIKNLGK